MRPSSAGKVVYFWSRPQGSFVPEVLNSPPLGTGYLTPCFARPRSWLLGAERQTQEAFHAFDEGRAPQGAACSRMAPQPHDRLPSRPPRKETIGSRRFPRCVTWCGYPAATTRARRAITSPYDPPVPESTQFRIQSPELPGTPKETPHRPPRPPGSARLPAPGLGLRPAARPQRTCERTPATERVPF